MMTAVIIIVIIALLILGHEWGHFIAARSAGIRVEEFGIGFPPRLFSLRKGETLYSFNLIPLGGFVRIYGEDGSAKDDKSSFSNHSLITRFKVIAAGVFMNLVLAFIFLSIVHALGVPTPFEGAVPSNYQNPQLQILGISPGSPAEGADLSAGDAILEVRGAGGMFEVAGRINDENLIEDFQHFINSSADQEVSFKIMRGKSLEEINLIPRSIPPEGQGPIGIFISKMGLVKTPFYLGWWEGLKSTINLTKVITVAFFNIIVEVFSTGKVTENLAGPVGIVAFTARAAKLGFNYLIQLAAILSINLAILNILPFPALDGGRLVFLGIEKIKGSPVSKKIEQSAHVTGFLILIVLLILVTWRDINRFFSF
jgi:regulator of sigma E protease